MPISSPDEDVLDWSAIRPHVVNTTAYCANRMWGRLCTTSVELAGGCLGDHVPNFADSVAEVASFGGVCNTVVGLV